MNYQVLLLLCVWLQVPAAISFLPADPARSGGSPAGGTQKSN